MKIIVDNNIPFAEGLLEPYGIVEYIPCEEFTPDRIKDADALLIRTRLRCGKNLLEGSRVKFVGTASIGYDHIDLSYCQSAGIRVANAPGCNAPGVAQYVMAAIDATCGLRNGLTLGVVGAGHVGSIVERWGRSMGMNVLVNDPPRQRREGAAGFCSLKDIAQEADIITFHTPLTSEGEDATLYLAGKEFFEEVRKSPVVINAARGGIVDEAEALNALGDGRISELVVDCWDGEPIVNQQLLEKAVIATPHIAGYSLEGKIRATQMVVDALADTFGLPRVMVKQPIPKAVAESMTMEKIRESYDIMADSRLLKADPTAFESLRNNYDYRPEP